MLDRAPERAPERAPGRARPKAGSRRHAFTLIELLLVMSIMAVLVAMVVGVGSYIIEEGKKKQTQQLMDHLRGAVQAYHRVTRGEYPLDRLPDANSFYDANQSFRALSMCLRGLSPPCKSEYTPAIVQATKPFLDQVGDPNGMTDGWGRKMRYYRNRGVGGKPVFLSPGPDEDFGDEPTRAKKRLDNVRSDVGPG